MIIKFVVKLTLLNKKRNRFRKKIIFAYLIIEFIGFGEVYLAILLF